MKPTLLDFSRESSLALHAQIIGDFNAIATPFGVKAIVVGAFARDLLLRYQYGIDPIRSTDDVDLAVICENWNLYDDLRSRLIASKNLLPLGRASHRLLHRCEISIDVVPCGGLETRERKIVWPPGDVVMDVFGFSEVLSSALDVVLPGQVRTHVISLPALALLKVICWRDRHYQRPDKDAQDLYLIMRRYLKAGNEPRLWDEFIDWTQQDSFDYEAASARMLGHDIGKSFASVDWARVVAVLEEQSNPEEPGPMPREMNHYEPKRARTLLRAFLQGLRECVTPAGSRQ